MAVLGAIGSSGFSYLSEYKFISAPENSCVLPKASDN